MKDKRGRKKDSLQLYEIVCYISSQKNFFLIADCIANWEEYLLTTLTRKIFSEVNYDFLSNGWSRKYDKSSHFSVCNRTNGFQ